MLPVIKCNNLGKAFGGLQALRAIDIHIEARTSTGLVGPNGAGKTTLFALFCGFLRPTSGSLKILEHSPDAAAIKGRIGILPQDIPMLRGIAVKEQLVLFARLQGYRKQAARQEAQRIIDLVNIGTLINQFPETLSYGQRKKVALAQAFLGQPEVILLDEPTSGLDPVAANEVRSIIRKNRPDHTFMISSHNLDEIKTACDEIIIIDKGRLVRHCPIDELIDRNNIFTLLLEQVPAAALIQSLRSLASVTGVETDAENDKRLTIYYQDEDPWQCQNRILECLQQNGMSIVEFSRGTAFAGRVIELVGHR